LYLLGTMSLLEITLVVAAYLIGSINSAIIVCRIMGLPDPRAEGSRNPGATNVLRIGGKRAAAVVLAGDMLKGLVAVLLARTLGAGETALAAAAAAAFLGHLYPLY
jgi:glycerol-3-phosphate acyltransferase PlsY